jgi:hypothetical protein
VTGRIVLERKEIHVIHLGYGAGTPSGSPTVPSGVENFMAGQTLSGHRVVRSNASGNAIYADRSDAGSQHVLGVTLGAAIAGDTVQVRRHGSIEEPSWSWTPNEAIFLGDNGVLTQAYPGGPVSLIVGFATTATSMFVAPREPIILT